MHGKILQRFGREFQQVVEPSECAKAPENWRSPGTVAFSDEFRTSRSVVDCTSPLALLDTPKRIHLFQLEAKDQMEQ
jgi:hypothetical protein